MTETVQPLQNEFHHGVPVVDVSANTSAGPPITRNMALARQYGQSFVQRIAGRDILFAPQQQDASAVDDALPTWVEQGTGVPLRFAS